MANKKYDGVIEAVHYSTEGRVDWVRAYLRRGPAWSDRVIIQRQDLIDEIKAGKRMALGKRVEFMAGTFDIGAPVQLVGQPGKEFIVVSNATSDCDNLEGAPLL
jgi:hypothetical protein